MPQSAPLPKVEATRGYGASVRLCGDSLVDAVTEARAFAEETGAAFIHPYDDRAIIAGQGTLGAEVVGDLTEIGTLVAPIGGGGLMAGVASAIKALSPATTLVGVEAGTTAAYLASREAGHPVDIDSRPTVADGIAVSRVSSLVFEHIEAHVDHLLTVDDAEMTGAVALLLERAKFLVEPSGAASLAAVLSGRVPRTPGPTVMVLSGGNVDLLVLDYMLRHGLEAAGRYGSFAVRVPDIPGQLALVVAAVAEQGANVVQVSHRREGIGLPYGHTEIRFAIETRDREQLDNVVDALTSRGIEVLR